MKRLAIRIIQRYQRDVSPNRPPACRFYPSCSEYGVQAIEHYGVLWGGFKTVWRIARCNPFNAGGYDPAIPEQSMDEDDGSDGQIVADETQAVSR